MKHELFSFRAQTTGRADVAPAESVLPSSALKSRDTFLKQLASGTVPVCLVSKDRANKGCCLLSEHNGLFVNQLP